MANSLAHWATIDVAGQPVDLYEPGTTPHSAVIWLQGTDQPPMQRQPAQCRLFAEYGLLVVCPRGGEGWWLDLPAPDFTGPLTPARFVTEALIDWLSRNREVVPPRIALAGVGRGGQAAVNIGFRQARRFPIVAAIAPDIDFHQWHGRGTTLDRIFPSREAARQQTATLHLHPLNWPRHLLLLCDPRDPVAWEGTERLAGKLISSGVPFECDFAVRAAGDESQQAAAQLSRTAEFLQHRLLECAAASGSLE